MTMPDNWEAFCRERGLRPELADGGAGGLVEQWRRTVSEIATGYRGDLDEYLNDMDARQILADFRAYEMNNGVHGFRPCEFDVDQAVRPQLVQARGCLWGEDNAVKHGWTPAGNWWYFTHPRHVGERLRNDLARRHLLAETR